MIFVLTELHSVRNLWNIPKIDKRSGLQEAYSTIHATSHGISSLILFWYNDDRNEHI